LERAVLLHIALEAAGIPHGFGGALALAYHVEDPRGTNDIDLNVTVDPAAPDPLFTALPADLPWSPKDVQDAVRDGQVRLYWPHPDGPPRQPTPVDFFLPQDEFHAVVAGRTEPVPMLETFVPIISATDLAIFKALFSRAKDWVDIEELLRYGDVDETEAQQWLVRLVGEDDTRLPRLRQATADARIPRNEPIAAQIFQRRKPRLGE